MVQVVFPTREANVYVKYFLHFVSLFQLSDDILRRDSGARMATGGGPVFQQLADLIKTKKSGGLSLLQHLDSEE